MLINFACVRLLSGGAYFTAGLAETRQWGLFNLYPLPEWFATTAGFVILDFAIYLQHRLFHRVPIFWRLHKVHHTDLGFDTTTAIRFHPAEIVLSMYYKMLLVLAFGLSQEAVLVFEIALNACALFNHGNVRLPGRWEGRIRRLLITTDLHRIHHSSYKPETDSNFGFSVPFWDRWCGTYRDAPALGQEGMEIGLRETRGWRKLGLPRLLSLPFS